MQKIKNIEFLRIVGCIAIVLILFNILKGSFWKYHPEWVYAHPILNIELAILFALLLGVFTYHFVEVPCANYLKKKYLTQT